MAPRTEIDPDRLKFFAKHLFDQLGGAMTAAMVYLGDHLGLFRTLQEMGTADSAALAEQTGLSERWVREWLYQQAASKIIESEGDGKFSLSPEGVAVLADENHPAFGAGQFCQLPATMGALHKLPEAFRTGRGLSYDDFGDACARGVERGFAPWYRNFLVPKAIPAIRGMKQRLEEGASVADVGCGGGVALLELARAFPNSSFTGYEISEHALDRAKVNREAAGVQNAHFHNALKHPLPSEGTFDLMLTFDCLHDMTRPDLIMKEIRGAIRDDGIWLIADMKARPTFEENAAKNPMAALMYGVSIMHCMSSSLSEPDGLGLGTLGLHPGLAEELAQAAGFTKFERAQIDHPINAFYVVEP